MQALRIGKKKRKISGKIYLVFYDWKIFWKKNKENKLEILLSFLRKKKMRHKILKKKNKENKWEILLSFLRLKKIEKNNKENKWENLLSFLRLKNFEKKTRKISGKIYLVFYA